VTAGAPAHRRAPAADCQSDLRAPRPCSSVTGTHGRKAGTAEFAWTGRHGNLESNRRRLLERRQKKADATTSRTIGAPYTVAAGRCMHAIHHRESSLRRSLQVGKRPADTPAVFLFPGRPPPPAPFISLLISSIASLPSQQPAPSRPAADFPGFPSSRLCPSPFALCPSPFALGPWPFALGPSPLALRPWPFALCP
jgi:hypothetical protein